MSNEITAANRSVEDMLIKGINLSKEVKRNIKYCETCKIDLWMSFFFDGTGNNFSNDFKPKSGIIKHSNVAALYAAHYSDAKKGHYKFYYEGIGTPFSFGEYYKSNISPRGDVTEVKGWDDSQNSVTQAANQAGGDGIKERLQKAIYQLIATIEKTLSVRPVTTVNVSAFGFSRGATEARVFMNWIKSAPKITIKNNKIYYRNNTEIKLKFLGIFDTVESIGIGRSGGNKNRNLYKVSIDKSIEHVVHLVASLELRKTFPLTVTGDLAETVGAMQKQEIVVYPGAHSNVGGGYANNEQMRCRGLSIIALHKMLSACERNSLKILSYAEMQKHSLWNSVYKHMYLKETLYDSDLNGFMSQIKVKSNKVKDHMDAHQKLYQLWISEGLYSAYINSYLGILKSSKNAQDKSNYELFSNIWEVLDTELPVNIRPSKVKTSINNYKINEKVKTYIENYVCDSLGGFSKKIPLSAKIAGGVIGGMVMDKAGYVLLDGNRADYFTGRGLINSTNLTRGNSKV